MICDYCEADSDDPRDNLHCVYDGSPHAWHRCDEMCYPVSRLR